MDVFEPERSSTHSLNRNQKRVLKPFMSNSVFSRKQIEQRNYHKHNSRVAGARESPVRLRLDNEENFVESSCTVEL